MNNNNKQSLPHAYELPWWKTIAISDWLSLLKGQKTGLPLIGLPAFQNFKVTELYPRLKKVTDSTYQELLKKIITRFQSEWQTAFETFKNLKEEIKTQELSGITFSLAFPILITYVSGETFTKPIEIIFTIMNAVTKDPSKTSKVKLWPHLKTQLLITRDEKGGYFLFSKGPNIESLSYWLSFQCAFLLYNLLPIVHVRVNANTLKPFNHLTWYWGSQLYYSKLDLPPTFSKDKNGNIIVWYQAKNKTKNEDKSKPLLIEQQAPHYLAQSYSLDSTPVKNLYIWLQCIIRAIPSSTPYFFGYDTKESVMPPVFNQRVQFVAALSHHEVTQDQIELLMQKITQEFE